MKTSLFVILVVALVIFVFVSCISSEVSWSIKRNSPDALRQTIGLASVAIGNLNPSARNPGLELLCTGLYDVPGGYCNYFALGVPYVNFTMASNFTTVKK